MHLSVKSHVFHTSYNRPINRSYTQKCLPIALLQYMFIKIEKYPLNLIITTS